MKIIKQNFFSSCFYLLILTSFLNCNKNKIDNNLFNEVIENKLKLGNESLLLKLEERFNYQIASHGITNDSCKYENYIKLLRANGGLEPRLDKEDIELLEKLKKVGLNRSRKENLNFLYKLTNEFSDKFEKQTLEYHISSINYDESNFAWSTLLEGLQKKYSCNDFNNNLTLKNYLLVFIFLNLEYNSF